MNINQRIQQIESRLGILEAIEISGNYTSGGIGYANSSGVLTVDATNFYWDATNKRLGIGTNAPTNALDVRSSASINGTSITDTSIEINANGSGNRNAFIDFHGDDTYTDYGLRVIRKNAGANSDSSIVHRGTGALQLIANEAGTIDFYISNTKVGGLTAAGNLNLVTGSVYAVNNTQVLTTRQTGWNAPTAGGGGLLRGTFDTGATLATTARTLAALITDLRTHGLINT